MVFTPGIPSNEVVSGYDIWSSMSCGDRPGHSVYTICWFSPMSGMASTGTGSLGMSPVSQLKGEVATTQPKNNEYQKCNQFVLKKKTDDFIHSFYIFA